MKEREEGRKGGGERSGQGEGGREREKARDQRWEVKEKRRGG